MESTADFWCLNQAFATLPTFKALRIHKNMRLTTPQSYGTADQAVLQHFSYLTDMGTEKLKNASLELFPLLRTVQIVQTVVRLIISVVSEVRNKNRDKL